MVCVLRQLWETAWPRSAKGKRIKGVAYDEHLLVRGFKGWHVLKSCLPVAQLAFRMVQGSERRFGWDARSV